MTRLRVLSVFAAAVLAVALFAAVASAQSTVTIVTGTVTLDGAAAPSGTTVNVTLSDGTVAGTGTTGGSSGLTADQYRIDVNMSAAWEAETANVGITGTSQVVQATAVLTSGRVRAANIVATTDPTDRKSVV